MTEKEKKILIRKIKKYVFLAIVVGIVLFVVLRIVLPKETLSSVAKELKTSVEQNASDAMVQRKFVIGIIREQEQYAFNDKRKNKAIIEHAIQVGETYLSTANGDDFYIQLALARLHFQLGGIAQQEGMIEDAVKEVQAGLNTFNTLSKTYEDNLVFRMYRAINLSNLPVIFEQSDNAFRDFSFVAEKVLSSSFNDGQELEQIYHKGALVVSLETGVALADEMQKEDGMLQEALEKAKGLFGHLSIDTKGDITMEKLAIE